MMKSSAPSSRPLSRLSMRYWVAVTKRTGIRRVRGLARRFRQVSNPSMPGICTSSSTRSYSFLATKESAMGPAAASSTRWLVNLRMVSATAKRLSSLSSTSSIRPMSLVRGSKTGAGGWQREAEARPLSHGTLQREVPAHGLNQPARDEEAQPPTRGARSGAGPSDPLKLLEHQRLLAGREPHAGVSNVDPCEVGRWLGDHGDPPALGELDGIANQIDHDLTQEARVTAHEREIVRCLQDQLQALGLGQRGESIHGRTQLSGQIGRPHGDLERP